MTRGFATTARVRGTHYRRSIRALDQLGDSASAFTRWVDAVKRLGGAAVAWPLKDKNAGKPAARFPVAKYVQLFNAKKINATAPQVVKGAYAWVLAPADAVAAAPHTMTTLERLENAAFTKGDEAADAAHLPSLKDLQKYLIIGAVGLGAVLVIPALVRR